MANSTGKPKAHLTEEMIVEYKAYFDAMDFEGSGKIPVINVAPIMRKLGLMPSNIEIEDMIAELDKDKTAYAQGVTFEQLCEMAARKVNDVYTEAEIIDCFRTFDIENNGFLHVNDLKRALCTMGENLTEDEFETMMEVGKVDEDGNLNYEEFVRNVMSEL